MLLAPCHNRIGGVANVRRCTAVFRAAKLVHHVTSILTRLGGTAGEAGADFSKFIVHD